MILIIITVSEHQGWGSPITTYKWLCIATAPIIIEVWKPVFSTRETYRINTELLWDCLTYKTNGWGGMKGGPCPPNPLPLPPWLLWIRNKLRVLLLHEDTRKCVLFNTTWHDVYLHIRYLVCRARTFCFQSSVNAMFVHISHVTTEPGDVRCVSVTCDVATVIDLVFCGRELP